MLELKSGTQLANRYSLVHPLGGGGEAVTWLANDKMTAASVALKIGAPESAGRLRAEWQSSIRMMHAHIVRAFEFHADDDVAFYSLQYIDGPDIGALSGRSPQEVLAPIGHVVDALRYVHGKGVVHRDIKASNVLLDANGAPYLNDFGVSAGAGEVASGGSLIAQSPQSLDGHPASPSDDIFALGALIYELLAGRSPWSPADVEGSIRQAAPPPLRASDGSPIPESVVTLIDTMLDRDASARPDAESVAETLRAAGFIPGLAPIRRTRSRVADEEVVASTRSIRPAARNEQTTVLQQAATSDGLNRNVVYGALGVLVVVMLGVVFFLPDRVVDRAAETVVEPEPDPRSAESAPASASRAVEQAQVRRDVYVDPAIRERVRGDAILPSGLLEGDNEITFNENLADYSGLDEKGRDRYYAEATVGELLSALEVLEGRGVERWAPVEHRKARELYEEGDKEYLNKQFAVAEELYLGALTVLEPLYDRIDPVFQEAYSGAQAAFDAGDRLEALRLFELAVAVTPTHPGAINGLRRAQSLEEVQRLVLQGGEYEEDLEYAAAQESYEHAIAMDPLWQPAHDGLARVEAARTKLEFDTRMSEGFAAISAGDYLGARAAFRVAQKLIPESTEPADGLLQVDQGLRMQDISTLEREARSLEDDEHWDAVITTYEEILKIDNTLEFASAGLVQAREMAALHARLDNYIAEPDKLSTPSVMQGATKFVVEITTRPGVGPRLAAQRDELSRLLKRAATPLPIPIVSDNQTDVVVYRVGRLGRFARKEINLRPGTYVAVGSRAGFRDVRLEFRVAPEIDIEPVIVQCEEPI